MSYNITNDWGYYVPTCHLDEDKGFLVDSGGTRDFCRKMIFCEDYFGIPNYTSCITACVISIVALYQFMWDHPVESFRYIGSLVFFNGVTSFINHYTGALIFSFLDNATMYLPLFFLASFLSVQFCQYAFYVNDLGSIATGKDVDCCNYLQHKCAKCIQSYRYCRVLLRIGCWLLGTLFVCLNLFNDWLFEPNEPLFIFSFGFPLILLIIIWCVIKKNNLTQKAIWFKYSPDSISKDNVNNSIDMDIIGHREMKIPSRLVLLSKVVEGYFLRGLIICIVCAILWLVTENICNDGEGWPKWLFGHAVWHVGMAYGVILGLLYFTYIQCIIAGHKVYFTEGLFFWRYCKGNGDNNIRLCRNQQEKARKFILPVLHVYSPNSESSDDIANLFKEKPAGDQDDDMDPQERELKPISTKIKFCCCFC